jgi:hypothetical protein
VLFHVSEFKDEMAILFFKKGNIFGEYPRNEM